MICFLSREQVTSVIPLVSTVFPRTLNLKLEGREFGGKSPALGPFFWMKLDPDSLTAHELERARWHPERDTLELAAAGAAKVLGPQHSATRAFARAAATMGKVDLWHARLALKTLRKDQRAAIAEAAEE